VNKKLYTLDPAETLDDLQDYFFPPYITLAHMFHAPSGWSLRPRVLKQYQLQYVIEGKADYNIGSYSYQTRKGDLLFHGPGELHHVNTLPGKPYVCVSIVFHFGGADFPLRNLIGFERGDAEKPHFMGNFSDNIIENQLSELIHHYRQPGLFHQQRCQHLLMGVLLTLAQRRNSDADTSEVKDAAGTAKLILIRNYIDSHLREGFSHEQLEQLTGWSRNYIIVQFKNSFGMSPLQYLVWIRLEKAKELALQSGLSFGEIAGEVGYSDIHSFGKIFKRKTGMSLSQFVATLYRDTPDR
jgi:AraC-like DNA-binding protein